MAARRCKKGAQSMRNFFLLTFVLALIPAAFLRPHVGILLWSWVSFMNPQRLSWGFAYDFPFAMMIGAATILAWLLSREPKTPPRDAITILIIAMAGWVSVTTFFAIAKAYAFVEWDRDIKILAMTVITIMVMRNRERMHALIWVVVISLGFYGAKGGLFTLVGGAENLVLGPAGTFLADNNSLSIAMTMIVPLMRYLQLHTASIWVRLGLSVVMVLTLFAIVGSYSRGALLAMAAMLGLLVIKSPRRGMILGAGLIAAVFAVAFTPKHWTDRMLSITDYKEDDSAQGRFDAWTFAFKLSLDRPIVGGGYDVGTDEKLFFSYVPTAPKARSFHSIIFEMLGEHGWVGLTLYLILLISALTMSRTIERRTRGQPDLKWAHDLSAMVQVSMVGYVVAGLFQDHAFFDVYYLLLAVIAATYGIVKNQAVITQAPAPAKYGAFVGARGALAESAARPPLSPSR